MNTDSVSFFSLLSSKMKWHQKRQSLFAENVANAETPGYRAKDLQKIDFNKMLSQSYAQNPNNAMALTHAKHMGTKQSNNSTFKEHKITPWEITHSRNGVILEQEMLRMGENQLDFDMTSNIYKKSVSLMKLALGKR